MSEQMLSIIVTAAGKGTRFGSTRPKQFEKINKIPIYIYPLLSIKKIKNVSEIFLTINKSIKEESIYKELQNFGLDNVKIVYGSNSRSKSVYRAFMEIKNKRNLVVIHDSVRPNFNFSFLSNITKEIKGSHGIILASKITDTIKENRKGTILQTIDRKSLWKAQTPQIFKYSALEKCYSNKIDFQSYTDESQLLEKNNFKIKIYENLEYNNKITTKKDLSIYKKLLKDV
tara:strand:+ start:556 stop:1242 length:687 start_codon:yes stop_codon:yes gene_type:complete